MKIYIIDGNAICYRAYYAYATRELKNSKGFPTNVPYGFMLCVKKILKDFKPDALLVCFDMKKETFRHEKFEAYKANRKPMPEDMVVQLPMIRRLIQAYQIPILEKEGYEADDLMGTLAKMISARGDEAVLVTSDKDAMQLIQKNVSVVDPAKDYVSVKAPDVKEKFGVEPNRVIEVLGLMGDSSDNIPGVPGIGPKGAAELIQKFQNLETLYDRLSQISSESKRELLLKYKDNAFLSRELATIHCDVPLDVPYEDFRMHEPRFEELKAILLELEFRSFLKDLPTAPQSARLERTNHLITDEKSWQNLKKLLEKQAEFALDFETTGLQAQTCEPVGLSFAFKPNEAYFVLFDRHVSGKSILKAKNVLNDLKPVLENPEIQKIGHNIKYEMLVLKQFGIELCGIGLDTMVASYLLNPSKPNHNMSDVALEYLGEKLIEIESLIGKGKNQINMAESLLDDLTKYGCQDSDVTFRLAQILRVKIQEIGLTELLNQIELPLISVLADIEYQGILIDIDFLKELSSEMQKSIDKLTQQIYKLSDREFNINSPRQLATVLFEHLKLPVIRKTKTGPSTDVDVLTTLSEMHELPKKILEYRELSKLKSTYVDTMPELVDKRTNRVHSSFNQTVTQTGRLSSSDPNLQNIPVRSEEGKKIRKAFISSKNNLLLSADYSQIELRILAHLAKDEALKKAFIAGDDIHRYTASLIFGVDQKDVTSKMRDEAKTVNFGVLYGMSPFGLSKALNISQEAAKDFIDAYFERYPKVKQFLDSTIRLAKEKGYVETLFKRRRYIPDIESKDFRMRQFAERTAINAPVQGTASDLIKKAMIGLENHLRSDFPRAFMLVQVHDELLFEVPQKEVNDVARLVKNEMEKAIELDVPIQVSLKKGSNWKDMEKFTT